MTQSDARPAHRRPPCDDDRRRGRRRDKEDRNSEGGRRHGMTAGERVPIQRGEFIGEECVALAGPLARNRSLEWGIHGEGDGQARQRSSDAAGGRVEGEQEKRGGDRVEPAIPRPGDDPCHRDEVAMPCVPDPPLDES